MARYQTLTRLGALLATLLLAAAGCGDGGEQSPCELVGGCGTAPCDDAHPCAIGHACADGICDLRCDDDLCKAALGERAECLGGARGSCDAVTGCGRTVDCVSRGDVCDHTSDTCFPADGGCVTRPDCPLLFEDAASFGLDCQNKFCRFPPPPLAALGDAPGGLEFLAPDAGATLGSSSELAVEVVGPPGVYVYVVTASAPRRLAELESGALWVAAVENPDVVHFADGTAPVQGGAAPAELPHDVPLYLSVLCYDPARLVAASPALPFTIGAGWKNPGDACTDALSVPGSCAHPTRLQACGSDGTCAVVCASNRDCPTSLTSGTCERATQPNGMRTCVPK